MKLRRSLRSTSRWRKLRWSKWLQDYAMNLKQPRHACLKSSRLGSNLNRTRRLHSEPRFQKWKSSSDKLQHYEPEEAEEEPSRWTS